MSLIPFMACILEIDVHTTEDVGNLLKRLQAIKGIKDIRRTETGIQNEG